MSKLLTCLFGEGRQRIGSVVFECLVISHVFHDTFLMECGSSAVECRTRNRESPCSNPLCYRFEAWAFDILSTVPQFNYLYLATDNGGDVSE